MEADCVQLQKQALKAAPTGVAAEADNSVSLKTASPSRLPVYRQALVLAALTADFQLQT